jgi:thymidylate synthase (FAD)
MDNIATLEKSFVPRRLFECKHTKVEVDAILIRVPEDTDSEDWEIIDGEDGHRYMKIRVEDALQDSAAIRSARVSTDRDTVAVNEKAQGLIKYLWDGSHVSPFEGGVIFRLKHTTPIAYAQPLFRLFASFNELSGRYSSNKDDYYMPRKVQGVAREIFERSERVAKATYQELLNMGVANEMARFAHLYRFYTKFFMTISLRHLMEFAGIAGLVTRHSDTEFWDIQEIYRDIIKHWTPWAYQALEDKPLKTNYLFVDDVLAETKKQGTEMPYLSSESVLKIGRVRLLNVFGNERMLIERLDDFPNPLRGFGHGGMTFYLKVPIFVFRQWVRHRYGVFSEPTVDYDRIVERNEFYIPERFRKQVGHVGGYTYSDMDDTENDIARKTLISHIDQARGEYRRLRNLGVPAEMAAMNLPYCFFISVYWTPNLESLMNFFSLRVDGHAQAEMRKYAEVIWRMCSAEFPRYAKIFSRYIYFGDQMTIKDFRPE